MSIMRPEGMNIQKDYELLLPRHKSSKTIERQVRRRTVAHDPQDLIPNA